MFSFLGLTSQWPALVDEPDRIEPGPVAREMIDYGFAVVSG
jgi:hypothetical protein